MCIYIYVWSAPPPKPMLSYPPSKIFVQPLSHPTKAMSKNIEKSRESRESRDFKQNHNRTKTLKNPENPENPEISNKITTEQKH